MESTAWKAKSINRGLEIKQLKKRIKELTQSRESWKEKYMRSKSRTDVLEARLKKTRELIAAILLPEQ
jgi:molecular chaperone GrpE (heat shock protein)